MASRAERRQFWSGHVAGFAVSGLTRQAYCERHGLKPVTLDSWRRRLGEPPAMAFVPVQPVGLARPERATGGVAALELCIGAARLDLPVDVDAAWLAALLRGLC